MSHSKQTIELTMEQLLEILSRLPDPATTYFDASYIILQAIPDNPRGEVTNVSFTKNLSGQQPYWVPRQPILIKAYNQPELP